MPMTEAEWLACADPMLMLEFLRGKVSERKLRLFGVACYRRAWLSSPLSYNQRDREVVETAERFADGLETSERLATAHRWRASTRDIASPNAFHAANTCTRSLPESAAWMSADCPEPEWTAALEEESAAQAAILRCVVQPHSRSAEVRRAWLTNTVASLAQTIYAARAFDRLPILADALEDAGCTNRDILDHCRQPGDHVRGCWVVDLVLGKS